MIQIPLIIFMAEGPGFEPGLTESESVVLPLDDPPEVLVFRRINEKRQGSQVFFKPYPVTGYNQRLPADAL